MPAALSSRRWLQTEARFMNAKTASIVLVLFALIAGGCSSQEKLPVVGEGGTPPPFKDKIAAGMAARDAAAKTKQGDRPSAKPTPTPGSN